MAMKATAWALEQQVGDPAAKLVLIGYAEHASRASWVAWPSRATVGEYAEVDVRHAHRLHKKLLAGGFIEEAYTDELPIEERKRYQLIPPNRRPKLWRLLGPGVKPLRGDSRVTPVDTGAQPVAGQARNDAGPGWVVEPADDWGDSDVTPEPAIAGVTSGVTSDEPGVTSEALRGDIDPGSGVTSDVTQRVTTKPSCKTALDDTDDPISIDQAESLRRARATTDAAGDEIDEAS
ncbi:MAG: hypothetical protein AAGA90_07835 [Actinomycetota bacterium]